jgi:signal-transduction protein with cAMP-binding, CBS, and nucleotidyltransferase domain
MDSPKSDYIRTLRRLPLFTDLSDVELAQIAEGVSRLYFEEGTLIFGEGDVCRELLIVEEGTVKMVKSAAQSLLKCTVERQGRRHPISSLCAVSAIDHGRAHS